MTDRVWGPETEFEILDRRRSCWGKIFKWREFEAGPWDIWRIERSREGTFRAGNLDIRTIRVSGRLEFGSLVFWKRCEVVGARIPGIWRSERTRGKESWFPRCSGGEEVLGDRSMFRSWSRSGSSEVKV